VPQGGDGRRLVLRDHRPLGLTISVFLVITPLRSVPLHQFLPRPATLSVTSVLSPQSWPFDLALLPQTAHLVGGSVRDALLARKADYLDLDFVLPEGAVDTARAIARQCQAGFVVLDEANQIARVVFAQATVDFAAQVGESLAEDLHRRDFTVNAIAYHPHTEQVFDPLGGYQDLAQRRLRMIAPDNLADDPLRLLRAYRQAAQLGFHLDPQTRTTIHELAPLLAKVAAERVRGELDCLLSQPEGSPLLHLAWADQVLQTWLPAGAGNPLALLDALDDAYRDLQATRPDLAALMPVWLKEQTPPGFHRSWFKAAKLSQILPPDLAAAEATLTHFKYSRAEQQAVLAIMRGWQTLQTLAPADLTHRQQYHLFKTVGTSFPGLLLVALAQGYDRDRLWELGDRWLDAKDAIAHPTPLVSGRDVMAHLHMRPGPQVGKLLSAVELAHAEGQVTTAAEALSWIETQVP
jgi:tRNA nucleotidyltransferase (CCA-adding enzyme)